MTPNRGLRTTTLLFACGACALTAGSVTARAAAQVAAHSRAEVRAQAERLQPLVRACESSAGACDPGAVPDDEPVQAEGGTSAFAMRWGWLRQALDGAKDASPRDRQEAMAVSAARLAEVAQQAGGGAAAAEAAEFGKARRTANTVLARAEFGAVAEPSAWDRFVAKFWAAVQRLFLGFGKLGKQAPWLGKALEWLFFLSAAVGLLLFLRRNFQRQRLAASLRGEQAVRGAWEREATDWAALAESAAGAGEWREAVHCLYWAAIVRLESRRAWRHNPARTPREYVRLLKAGSVQRESLHGLTGLLERVWYGLRPAGAEEYRNARAWFDRLGESGAAQAGAGTATWAAGGERA